MYYHLWPAVMLDQSSQLGPTVDVRPMADSIDSAIEGPTSAHQVVAPLLSHSGCRLFESWVGSLD